MKTMTKSRVSWLLLPVFLLAAACGDGDDASSSDGDKAAVESASDAAVTDMGLDASTADAMSVDVAAGGIEPMAEPAVPVPVPATAVPAAEAAPAETR